MDRLLALSSTGGTVSFLFFLADSCGYCGSITLLLLQYFGPESAPSGSGGSSGSGAGGGGRGGSGGVNGDAVVDTFTNMVLVGGAVMVLCFGAGAAYLRTVKSSSQTAAALSSSMEDGMEGGMGGGMGGGSPMSKGESIPDFVGESTRTHENN